MQFVTAGTNRIAFESREGRLPVLICVHGNSSHRGLWNAVLDRFPGQASISIDLRGHGDSDWVRPPAYGTADYASDIREVVEQTGLKDFVLVGHSNGALA